LRCGLQSGIHLAEYKQKTAACANAAVQCRLGFSLT
jgi:hypothetical protein